MFSLEGLDHGLLYGLNQGRVPAVTSFMVAISTLGGTVPLAIITCVVAGICFAKSSLRFRGFATLLGMSAGVLLVELIKQTVARERPNIVPWAVPDSTITSLSFPSGHASNNALFIVLVLSILATVVRNKRLWWLLASTGFMWVLAMGVSRIYLGVHWPTDVIAGWCIGGLIGMSVHEWMRSRPSLDSVSVEPTS
ncbi:MAG: phosphatase PAP2 family protein [Planctomycetota bacterium]